MSRVWSQGGFVWVTVLFSEWSSMALSGVSAEAGLLVFPSDEFTSPGAHRDTSGRPPGCCSSVSKSVQILVTPWTAAHQASLSSTISWCLLKLMSVESVMPSSHLILSCPLLLLPSVFPSIRVLSSESAFPIRWPKYWSFSFSISPSNEYSQLTSFRIEWFDLLATQGTSGAFYNNTVQKHQFLGQTTSAFLC